MAGVETTVERLRKFLPELSLGARSLPSANSSAACCAAKSVVGADLVLQELRSIVREQRDGSARSMNRQQLHSVNVSGKTMILFGAHPDCRKALTLWPRHPSNTGPRCGRRSPNVFRNNRPFWSRPGCEYTPENSDHAENRYGDGDDDCPDNGSSKEELVFRSAELHLLSLDPISRLINRTVDNYLIGAGRWR
jgi:hypothetical protein